MQSALFVLTIACVLALLCSQDCGGPGLNDQSLYLYPQPPSAACVWDLLQPQRSVYFVFNSWTLNQPVMINAHILPYESHRCLAGLAKFYCMMKQLLNPEQHCFRFKSKFSPWKVPYYHIVCHLKIQCKCETVLHLTNPLSCCPQACVCCVPTATTLCWPSQGLTQAMCR